ARNLLREWTRPDIHFQHGWPRRRDRPLRRAGRCSGRAQDNVRRVVQGAFTGDADAPRVFSPDFRRRPAEANRILWPRDGMAYALDRCAPASAARESLSMAVAAAPARSARRPGAGWHNLTAT